MWNLELSIACTLAAILVIVWVPMCKPRPADCRRGTAPGTQPPPGPFPPGFVMAVGSSSRSSDFASTSFCSSASSRTV